MPQHTPDVQKIVILSDNTVVRTTGLSLLVQSASFYEKHLKSIMSPLQSYLDCDDFALVEGSLTIKTDLPLREYAKNLLQGLQFNKAVEMLRSLSPQSTVLKEALDVRLDFIEAHTF